MFKAGDKIVHQRHGAGTVMEPRVIERDGERKEYFCIELIGDRGMLMIPAANVDSAEIRSAMLDTNLISTIMSKPPAPLSNDHRARQNQLKAQIKTRDPKELAAALRDLCWRERTDKLTFTDAQLKDSAFRLLTQELALNPSFALDTARTQINLIIENTMTAHLQNVAGV